MQECELCGRKTESAYIVSIEEVELKVCPRCAKGNHVIREVTEGSGTRIGKAERQRSGVSEAELVEDYGTRIRNAREHMKIPIKVLAEMLSEKETLLLRVEQQKTLPPEGLRKKLEKTLGIKLEETQNPDSSGLGKRGRTDEATLGEFA